MSEERERDRTDRGTRNQRLRRQTPHRLRREAAAAWAACGAFERAAFVYFGVSSALIALFAEHLRHPMRLLGMRAIVVCVVVAVFFTRARDVLCILFSRKWIQSDEYERALRVYTKLSFGERLKLQLETLKTGQKA